MENTIRVFQNAEFGNIRTVEDDGKVLFCGKDIAEALGYTNPRKALADHCKGVTKRYALTEGGRQELSFIPEGDVYRLICGSKLPSAERFERWVFDEVLPAIRMNGMYATPATVEKILADPDTFIKILQELKEERARVAALRAVNKANAPKVLFADSVASAQTDILIGDLAKLIRQNGVDIGQRRLFEWMRENGYLIKQRGLSWNMPTQRAMELGLFRVKESTIDRPDGSVQISRTTKVTGKGQIFFVNRFLEAKAA